MTDDLRPKTPRRGWGGIRSWHMAGFLGLMAIHLAMGWSAADDLSPTFDEAVHLAAGYAYWSTGDYRLNGTDHPAFAKLWAATPLLNKDVELDTQDPLWVQGWPRIADQFVFADRFLYENRISADELLVPARRAMFLLSPLLALIIFLACARVFGPGPALGAVGLYAFSPSMLAHAGLITTDFSLTLFFFLFFFLFLEALRASRAPAAGEASILQPPPGSDSQEMEGRKWRRDAWWWVGCGLAAGLALSSKYSAVALGPAILLVLGWEVVRHGVSLRRWMRGFALMVPTGFLVVACVYRIHELPVFLEGLRNVVNAFGGRDTFIWGRNSDSGVWYYFPLAFLIKSSLPELLVLGVGLFLAFSRRLRGSLVWFLPALTFIIIACTSNVNIGHRHILPVYPFLFVLAAAVFASLRPRAAVILGTLLIPLQALGAWRSSPETLAYFNELVGGSDRGYHYLTDSNVDWGQGLRELSRFLREGEVGAVYLSYFGSADPTYEGMDVVHVGSFTFAPREDTATLEDIQAEERCLFAISVTNFQHTYYQSKDLFLWLREHEPEALIARSILIYDLTDSPSGRRHLAELLTLLGKDAFAQHEMTMAAEMDSGGH
jgi:hypothetical protein